MELEFTDRSRRHRLILMIGIILALLAGMTAFFLGNQNSADAQPATRQVLVASQTIPARTIIESTHLVLRALPSLPLRYAAHDAGTRALASWMITQPEVKTVLHPALSTSPGHGHWREVCSAAAGLFSVVFHERHDAARVDAFIDALRLFKIGYSWGGPMSLAVPYEVGGMRSLGWTQGGPLVRFAVGLERVEDLQADLDQALRKTLRAG